MMRGDRTGVLGGSVADVRAQFSEPMQLGAIQTMGILKAWAPTRSYGLLVRLTTNIADRQRPQPVRRNNATGSPAPANGTIRLVAARGAIESSPSRR